MTQARNTFPRTALAARILELVEQSKRYQADLARVAEEIEQLKGEIERMAPKGQSASDELAA